MVAEDLVGDFNNLLIHPIGLDAAWVTWILPIRHGTISTELCHVGQTLAFMGTLYPCIDGHRAVDIRLKMPLGIVTKIPLVTGCRLLQGLCRQRKWEVQPESATAVGKRW